MAPRGMKALSLSAVRGPVGLQSGPLVPAPIYVYLQLPEALISGALGSTGLWWAGAAGGPEPEATGASDALYDTAFPLQEGLRQTLRADRPYRIPLALSPSATFRGDQADLRFSPGAAGESFVSMLKPTWRLPDFLTIAKSSARRGSTNRPVRPSKQWSCTKQK